MLTFQNLVKAYNGKRGCMCGCNGDYAYTGDHGQASWQGSINLAKAKRRFNTVMNNPDKQIQDDIDGGKIVFVDSDNRSTVLYFKPSNVIQLGG